MEETEFATRLSLRSVMLVRMICTSFFNGALLIIGAPVPAGTVIILVMSVINVPEKLRALSQIASYFPATFPGSWTFTDYRLVEVFGCRLNCIQATPVVFAVLAAASAFAVRASYFRTQIEGR